MDDQLVQYVGLDVGATLTLASFWSEPAGARTGPAAAAWPVRARVEGLRVTAVAGTSEIHRLIGELCTQHDRRLADCTLVKMGWTSAELAAETAAGLGLRGVIEPPQRFVLWTEGVLPAREMKEYARPLPPFDARDLDGLRLVFAELMEQAAEAVQTQVLDQDNTVLDRYIDVRYQGTTEVRTVPAESLTDPVRLLAPFHAACTQAITSPVEIVAARLRCIVLT